MATNAWTTRLIDAPEGDLLSKAEVAKLFGVSTDTLSRWIDDGEFPAGLIVGKQALVWDWRAIAYYRLKLEMSTRLVPATTESAENLTRKPTATGGKPTATGG